jgi:uncharacterized cupredoxin-like copper-binding protein
MLKSRLLFTAVMLLTLSVRAAIGHSAGGHRHETLGEPGDPDKPTRIVEITMREDEATIQLTPEQVDVRRGEQVRLKITTEGQVECVLGTKAGIENHAEEIERDSEKEHDHSPAKKFAKFASGELLWRFTQKGQFAFECMLPGRFDREIKGIIK